MGPNSKDINCLSETSLPKDTIDEFYFFFSRLENAIVFGRQQKDGMLNTD